MNALPDSLVLAGPVVLGYEGGEGIAEVLHRHIGEGIDLHRCGEGGHDHRAKAVHQPLDHKNAEVHHRLLQTGEQREFANFP